MLPILLDAGSASSDVTAYVISGLGAAVAAMASLIAAIALAKVTSLTKADKEHVDKIHAIELEQRDFKAFAGTAAAKITALEAVPALTTREFNLATDGQNEVLRGQTDELNEIKRQLRSLDKSKASRSDLLAARPLARAPIPRTDGPTGEPPSTPPPPPLPPQRRTLPSIR